MSTRKINGGCACGNIRYEIQGEMLFSFHCQCNHCQKITGAGHSSQFMVKIGDVDITGEMRFYEQKTDDSNIKSSGFCHQCGSPILTKSSGYPDSLYLHASTLDDGSLFKPDKLVWSSSAQEWDYIDPEIEVL